MHDSSCEEKQKLAAEAESCLLRHRQSVKVIMSAVGNAEEFDLAFRKSKQEFEALRSARELLADHVAKHRCGLPRGQHDDGSRHDKQPAENRQ